MRIYDLLDNTQLPDRYINGVPGERRENKIGGILNR